MATGTQFKPRTKKAPAVLVEAPHDPTLPFHFELPCFGLCAERRHIFIGDGSGKVRVRHGEGEAWREFTEAEYVGWEYLEWIASVHRYEEGR